MKKVMVAIAILCLSGCASLSGGTAGGTAQPLISSALYALAVFNTNGCLPATATLDPSTACLPANTTDVNGTNACLVAIAVSQIAPRLPKCQTVPSNAVFVPATVSTLPAAK